MERRTSNSAEARARTAALVAGAAFLAACGERPTAPETHNTSSVVAGDALELERLRARVAQLEDELAVALAARPPAAARTPERASLELELRQMRAELITEQERRLEREREWLRYTSAVASLDVQSIPAELSFTAQVPESERPKPPEPPPPLDEKKLAREKEILRTLKTMLTIEGVRGIDLLEAGELGNGCVGPVLFRIIDERGRLAGSLSAKRLKLEGSRTAHTLTLVLEDGFETRGGVRTPFTLRERSDGAPIEGGTRRIQFEEVDLLPWVNALPELFGDVALEPSKDDGLWNATYVKGALNRLMRMDAANGYWRVRDLAGVTGVELRDVRLEGLDSEGKVERQLFADRMKIELQEKGVLLLLEDGAQTRGADTVPFLDARFRIFLPRAPHADWQAAGLPGLSQPDGAAKAPAAGDAVQTPLQH